MYRVIEQTYEEKLAMYMNCDKEQLAKMLIECNRILDLQARGDIIVYLGGTYEVFENYTSYTVYNTPK